MSLGQYSKLVVGVHGQHFPAVVAPSSFDTEHFAFLVSLWEEVTIFNLRLPKKENGCFAIFVQFLFCEEKFGGGPGLQRCCRVVLLECTSILVNL